MGDLVTPRTIYVLESGQDRAEMTALELIRRGLPSMASNSEEARALLWLHPLPMAFRLDVYRVTVLETPTGLKIVSSKLIE